MRPEAIDALKSRSPRRPHPDPTPRRPPPRHWIVILIPRSVLAVLASFAAAPAIADSPPLSPISATAYQDTVYPALMQFCGDCHHPDDEEDVVGFLKDLQPEDLQTHRGVWSSVAEQLLNRTMPPADAEQPGEAERLAAATWITDYLRQTACDGEPTIGAPPPRRLNRDQYSHAIADLFGQPISFGPLFPSDGSGGEGFTNHADSLFVSPILIEKYLEATQRTLAAFLISPPVVEALRPSQRGDNELAFWLAGDQTLVLLADPGETQFRVDGVPVQLSATGQDNRRIGQLSLTDGPHRMEWSAGGSVAAESVAGGLVDRAVLVQTPPRPITDEGDEDKTHGRDIAASIEGVADWLSDQPADRPLAIDSLRARVLELWDDRGGKPLADRRDATAALIGRDWQTLADDPVTAEQARRGVLRIARLAWRRPLDASEADRISELLGRGLDRGEPVISAMRLPLTAVLCSPNFLFVTERPPAAPGPHRVTDLELASRLSLMLWNSLPDDELLKLAAEGKLSTPNVLDGQIRRMIADPKAVRMGDAFAAQWLGTDAVGRTKIPDTAFYKPAYSSELVESLTAQVGRTFVHHLRHDRPVTDWIDADYVVVDQRLAKHYEIEAPKTSGRDGDEFSAVAAGDDINLRRRSGVLGLGAVHLLTSYGRRTSPVLRGGWVLETCFGVHLPAPPADVPELPGGEKENGKQSVRQRLAMHRDNPTCAACHNLIDPIGFALENFDVLGRWRDNETKPAGKQKREAPWDELEPEDMGPAIDPSGQLPTGERFADLLELRQLLLNRRDDFTRHYVRKLLGYSLARSLDDGDACTIERITRRCIDDDYSTLSIIRGIVHSDPFGQRDG